MEKELRKKDTETLEALKIQCSKYIPEMLNRGYSCEAILEARKFASEAFKIINDELKKRENSDVI